jgi:hypothetical protein
MKANIFYNKANQKQIIEIYNLAIDPFEKNNLANTSPELKEEFLKLANTARIESDLFPLTKKTKKTKITE